MTIKDSEGNIIPDWIIEKGTEVILDILTFRQFVDIRKAIAKDPETWYVSTHFTGGMYVRNLLRKDCCPDTDLPSGNWDDVYTQVIEAAIRKGNIRLSTGNLRSA